ncbi:MAG: hypothetical protein LC789_09605 [Actinobacteria bacterium]|nr:hypothetical protein [Actinomycetota bacterium]
MSSYAVWGWGDAADEPSRADLDHSGQPRQVERDGAVQPHRLDAAESALTGTLTTGEAALVLGFESLVLPLGAETDAALALCPDWSRSTAAAGPSGCAPAPSGRPPRKR